MDHRMMLELMRGLLAKRAVSSSFGWFLPRLSYPAMPSLAVCSSQTNPSK